MKLNVKYDVEAPAAYVFDQLTDFEGWERAAMRLGADVVRTDRLTQVAAGMGWDVQFRYRGKDRKMKIALESLTPASAMVLQLRSAPVNGVVQVDLLELAAKRTRITVKVELKPNTLAARLYFQTLRLARSRAERGFAQRVGQLCTEIEDRYRGTPAMGRV